MLGPVSLSGTHISQVHSAVTHWIPRLDSSQAPSFAHFLERALCFRFPWGFILTSSAGVR